MCHNVVVAESVALVAIIDTQWDERGRHKLRNRNKADELNLGNEGDLTLKFAGFFLTKGEDKVRLSLIRVV